MKPSTGCPVSFSAPLGLLALALAPLGALAGEPAVEQQLKALLERLQVLEQRNQELERKVQALSAPPAAAPGAAAEPGWGAAREERLQAVEAQQRHLTL